jgi:hypothetical protein
MRRYIGRRAGRESVISQISYFLLTRQVIFDNARADRGPRTADRGPRTADRGRRSLGMVRHAGVIVKHGKGASGGENCAGGAGHSTANLARLPRDRHVC